MPLAFYLDFATKQEGLRRFIDSKGLLSPRIVSLSCRPLPPSDNKGKDLAVIKQILHWYILSERKIRVPRSRFLRSIPSDPVPKSMPTTFSFIFLAEYLVFSLLFPNFAPRYKWKTFHNKAFKPKFYSRDCRGSFLFIYTNILMCHIAPLTMSLLSAIMACVLCFLLLYEH